MLRYWIIGSAGAVTLCAAPIAVQAAPLGDLTRPTALETSALEKVASRRCWWRNGERHCRQARHRQPRAYSNQDYPAYGRPRPEDLPTGSSAWWRAMDYERRGGFGGVD
jgi:hypothetical protein